MTTVAKSKYEKLASMLEKDIRGGVLLPGQPVPPVRTLMVTEGLSNGTILKGLELLEKQGLLERHAQRGFFVVDRNRPSQEITQIAFFSRNLSEDILPYVHGIHHGIQGKRNTALATYTTQGGYEEFRQLLDKIVDLRPSGAILTGFEPERLSLDLQPVLEVGIKVVLIGSDPMGGIDVDRVMVHTEDAGRKITRHLLTHGAENLAVLMYHPPSKGKDQFLRGVRQALDEAGLDLPEERVLWFEDPHGYVHPPDPSIDAQNRVAQALEEGMEFDAMLTFGSYHAVGATEAITRANLRVPEDVKVAAGFGHVPRTAGLRAITAIDTHRQDQAAVATELLLRRINGYDGVPEAHYVFGELIQGETT